MCEKASGRVKRVALPYILSQTKKITISHTKYICQFYFSYWHIAFTNAPPKENIQGQGRIYAAS